MDTDAAKSSKPQDLNIPRRVFFFLLYETVVYIQEWTKGSDRAPSDTINNIKKKKSISIKIWFNPHASLWTFLSIWVNVSSLSNELMFISFELKLFKRFMQKK